MIAARSPGRSGSREYAGCMNACRDPDPQPGDFDADLDDINPRHVETHPGDPDIRVTVVTASEDDTADRR